MFRTLLPAALLLAPAAAQAGSVVLWPVDPKIAAGERATALWLENSGAEPILLQVRALAWSQAAGEDALADQDEIVSSPPMIEVAPGQRQLVRVIRRHAAAEPGERAFRLLIDEVPRDGPPGAATPGARLNVQMRYSLPLFVGAVATPEDGPALSARIEVAGGERVLALTNSGRGHARLTDLSVGATGHEHVVRQGLAGYVLPGATMRWALPGTAAGATVSVSVNGRPVTLGPTA